MFKLKKIPIVENETCKNCHFDNFCGKVGASKIQELTKIRCNIKRPIFVPVLEKIKKERF
mgnify:CR=1 FL=1